MDKCGCGKQVRYVHSANGKEVYACNKYGRCPTYEELRKELEKTKELLAEYYKLMEAHNIFVLR